MTKMQQTKDKFAMVKQLKTVSLFSGGGGLDLGFASAGFDICFSSDIDEHSCQTLLLNQGKTDYWKLHPVLKVDVNNLTAKQIFEKTGLIKGDVDFLIGGPPCQAFSVFGKRKGIEDPRGNLVWEYVRIIQELEPEGFLFENVSGLKSIHGGSLYSELLEALSCDGQYKISEHEYELADFGIPQHRKRVFFIGSRSGKEVPPMEPTHYSEQNIKNNTRLYQTVHKVFVDLPSPTDIHDLFNHVGRKHSQRIIDRYESLKHGERDHKTRINKLDPKRPSYTIIVGSDKGGGKGHVHPYEPREVTPRESARIQTFPDWWEFYGSGRHVIRQVGNAVPPLFAAQIATYIKKHLFGIEKEIEYSEHLANLRLSFLDEA